MKVKMLTSIASADWAHKPGDVIDIDDGAALCAAGLAVPVKDVPKKKKAVKRGRETAALK